MKNFVQSGEVITCVAPYAVNSGDGVLAGFLFGVAAFTAAQGVEIEVKTEGVYDLAALSTDAATQGAKVYWDNTNRRATVAPTGNTLIGATTVAKVAGATTARVYLDGTIR